MNDAVRIRTVDAQISYLAPGSSINRRFVAPGAEVNTGTYAMHRVRIRDGRSVTSPFSLDVEGFVLAEHRSSVADFRDAKEVDAAYPPEVVEVVRRLTGADRVVLRGWMVRTAGELPQQTSKPVGYRHHGGVQPPASEAHVDFTPATAAAVASRTYAESFPGTKPYSRFIAASLWRTFSPPPQDWPLALCDASSVGANEGAPNALVIVDEIPDRETMLGDLPAEKTAITAAIFHYNPNHRWWYFSNMTRDEVVLLKFHDSDPDRARRVPHTAFHDTSLPGAHPRESIEVRVVAYFLD
jgi:hypothetical protein